MPKPKIKTPAPAADPRAAIVDEFVPLARLVEEFAPTRKLYEEKRKKIMSWADSLAPDQSVTFKGLTQQVVLGPRAKERRIKSMSAVAKFFGARFFEFCSFALKHIDSEMTAAERAKFLVEEQTGNRPVTTGPRI